MSLNLASILRNSAARYPNLTATIDGGVRSTYRELDEAARRFAGELLAAGVQPGDRVAVMVPNVPGFTIAYFGVLYAGCVVVPLNTLLVANEVAFQLEDSEARALVVHSQTATVAIEGAQRVVGCRHIYTVGCDTAAHPVGAKRLEEVIESGPAADLAQTAADDTAVVLYTSGTTGKPKGAELTHFGLYYNAQLVAERVFSRWPDEISVLRPGDVALAALPLYHAFGQTNIQNALLYSGGAISYLLRFCPADASAAIARDRVTFFAGVPTMYIALLTDPAVSDGQLATLRYCVSGGSALPIEVKQQFTKRFDLAVQEGYGLSETSPLACIQSIDEAAKAGTIGKAAFGVEMKIVDDQDLEVPRGERGEIVIRGHNIMKGYFKRPEATAAAMRNGWFHSGDIGYVDEDGDFVIVDRKKDLIIRGGFNVYPREVEEALYTHPAIAEAAVIGVPDARLGEEVTAFVAFKPGMSATVDQIVQHCKTLVAAYKYPRVVTILETLPKGPTGKILKRALRE
ncbi:MAG TPA: long-chain fatty acid--CoA ligase [Planctomycetaceae bacterium]|jgi:long-chain acyl-CoA synthetase|nr:long-chain fatty acid--CoA ligase [Planctomycetaceae bacterium]